MLMDMGIDPGGHQRAMGGSLADPPPGHQRDTRRLHLDADGAVLIEIPEEAVDIVADGRGGRHHQPARPAHRRLAAGEVAELPQDAEILFVDADRIADEPRPAEPVMTPDVDIADMAEAIAAELQRVEELADAVLAGVEGIAPIVATGRVAIGHDHLGKRGAVHDRPQAPAILIADGVEGEPLADIEAEAKLPFL